MSAIAGAGRIGVNPSAWQQNNVGVGRTARHASPVSDCLGLGFRETIECN